MGTSLREIVFEIGGGQQFVQGNPWTARAPFGREEPVALLPDGRLLDLFWTYDNHVAAYLNIHARASADGGRTWSALWDTGVPGQPAPVAPRRDTR